MSKTPQKAFWLKKNFFLVHLTIIYNVFGVQQRKNTWSDVLMYVCGQAGQVGWEVGVVGVCCTWPPPGIMTCPTPGLGVAGQTSPFLWWAVNWPQGQSGSKSAFLCVCVFQPQFPVIWSTLTRQQDRTIKMSIFPPLSFAPSLCMLQAKWGRWLNKTNSLEEWHFIINPLFVYYTHHFSLIRSSSVLFGIELLQQDATPSCLYFKI